MSAISQEVVSSKLINSNQHGKALIVDDDITNRLVLRKFLSLSGFEIIEAENGEQAIVAYMEHHPDIIFMDVMMPIMDGFESAKKIKSLNKNNFVPIIFLTAMDDNDTIMRCTEAGGDDFINKPINITELQAKVHSMERIRDTHREIINIHHKMYHEQQVAEHIFNNVVNKNNAHIEHIHTLLKPLDLFSGDMLLTAFTPSRDIHILLADFTGHGLSAALGALPASEVFHAMTAKGYAIDEVLHRINDKLKHILPVNMFMAAQYIVISHKLEYIIACNCGMPDIVLLDRERTTIKSRISSCSMPLGIDPNINFSPLTEHCDIEYGDRIILSSDGIHEATNCDGEEFGTERFEKALISAEADNKNNTYFDNVVDIFYKFCNGSRQTDDISLVEIPCLAENLPPWDIQAIIECDDEIELDENKIKNNTPIYSDISEINLLFNANNLRFSDPVPLIINHIKQLGYKDIPQQSLFLILTELYVNALDHGILGLDSSLKANATGFEKYFTERELRLKNLERAHIRIKLQIQACDTGGQFKLYFEDSGPGFDYKNVLSQKNTKNAFSGRGIALIKQLCSSLVYRDSGNRVEVTHHWDNTDL